MQPDIRTQLTIKRIARKEITLFFASPVAYLFLASFAAISLFIFFWGEAFFARNIADVRPLFEWMPVLLIFLCSTLTMRLWSEERRAGTLEYVLTQAVPLWHFVVGKFLGCLYLLLIALLITLPLPATVAIIGDLDWGPVFAGYLATLFLGAVYLSIGLFVSARSDNQIVSLITASVMSGVFYLLGTPVITDFFGNQSGELLRLFGTGSRFDSITRGVIDIRDIYYYISLVLVFLSLNVLALEKQRWITDGKQPHHQRWLAFTLLFATNALAANLWLGQFSALRIDMTRGNQYSISEATQGYLEQLREPLLIRGYFSNKTHPLLAPLMPQLRDLIKEYEIAGDGKVRAEFIDPQSDPDLEKEANQKYGIQPVPFQIADRYQSSIVSSYFNVLIQYGDEHQVLGFRDLIEVQVLGEADINVQLRNPEHDLTRTIKKVLQSYQTGGNLFDTVKTKLTFNAYFSQDEKLPEQLVAFKNDLLEVLKQTQQTAKDQFEFEIIDPDANNGEVGQKINEEFGFKPMATSLFSDQRFYFYMTLQSDKQIIQIPMGELTKDDFERNLNAGIKRFASGFTKTVALVTPKNETPNYGHNFSAMGPRFSQLDSFLSTDMNVLNEDLSDGSVSGQADILVLAAPKELTEMELFAVDQFLMKGGTVIAATSPYSANLSARNLSLGEYNSGLENWLEHHGFKIEKSLVMDPRNAAFPVPIMRNVGGFQLREMRLLDYPYFIDVRGEDLNQQHLVTSELPQVTVPWASPIFLDEEKLSERSTTPLIYSSVDSWVSSSTDIMPRLTADGVAPYHPESEIRQQLVGVISEGRFTSFYAGKSSPLAQQSSQKDKAEDNADEVASESKEDELRIDSVIERSPESARIVLFSSNDFLRDQVIQLTGSVQQTEYLNTLQLIANAVDWSLEDAGLLSIRSRAQFNRTLPPMAQEEQMFWEYLNYGLALMTLAVLALIVRQRRLARNKKYLELLAN